MKYPKPTVLALFAASATAHGLLAQTAPTPAAERPVSAAPASTSTTASPAPVDEADSDVVVLSPFEVRAETDTGYQATETLAGTRIRTDLKNVGAAISVITREFLQDIGATDNTTLLQYTTNAEVAGTRSTYTGAGNGTSVDESGTLRAPAGANRVRGLSAADNTRDFFVSDIPWDGFNVERVDIQRGPNSILFGLGKPAGIVNASLRNAEFRNRAQVETRTGSYGSLRGTLDVNRELIDDMLAIRVAGLWDHEKFRQNEAFDNKHRGYVTVRFDPQLFKNRSFRTSIRAKYERGETDANRPRTVTPNDSLTAWFRPTAVSAANPFGGMNRLLVANGYDAERLDSTPVAGDGRGITQTADPDFNAWVDGGRYLGQQQPGWFIDGTSAQLYRIFAGYINSGARTSTGAFRSVSDGMLGKRFAGAFYGTGDLAGYATRVRLPGYQFGQYRIQSLLDPSVFNFYDTLIDGPNKSETARWDAYNVSLSQTAFDDRIGVELAFDKQEYRNGWGNLFGNPTISIDITSKHLDLADNPNVGRPFVTTNGGGGGSGLSTRQYARASLFAELRAADLLDNSFLVRLLGKHRLNGVYSKEKYATDNRGWRNYAANTEWYNYWNGQTNSNWALDDRAPQGIVYLGSSLRTRTDSANSNIPGISVPIVFNNGPVYHFMPTWTNFAVPFGDAWTVPANLLTIYDPATAVAQNSNPANYIGWNSNYNIDLLRWQDGDRELMTSASKSLRETESLAGSLQSFWWNNALVTTVGWRFDQVNSRDVAAPRVSSNRNILNMNPDVFRLPANPSVLKDHSLSWGGVLHLNQILPKDPLPINVSLSYNRSDNFEIAGARRNIYGDILGNPSGKTIDVGVLLSTKDGKYSFRAVKYESSVQSASLSGIDVGGPIRVIADGLRWTNVFEYNLGGYTMDTVGQNPNRHNYRPDTANGETQAQATARENAAIAAWRKIQNEIDPRIYAVWGFDVSQIYSYATSAPPGLTTTGDTKSEGYEYELTANPLKNWRVSFNASETVATRTNIGGPEATALVNYMDAAIAGAAGDLRQFDGGPNANTFRINYNNWRGNWTLAKLQEGAAAPEIRKWRYNVVTNYSFREGWLKGTGIGGSYRWQDKVIIGYPVVTQSATAYSFDLSQPYYGPEEDGTDLWVSYERKFGPKLNWKLQLNVRNAFAKDGLIPISVQPDGKTWASVRTKPNQEWFLTNTFTF